MKPGFARPAVEMNQGAGMEPIKTRGCVGEKKLYSCTIQEDIGKFQATGQNYASVGGRLAWLVRSLGPQCCRWLQSWIDII